MFEVLLCCLLPSDVGTRKCQLYVIGYLEISFLVVITRLIELPDEALLGPATTHLLDLRVQGADNYLEAPVAEEARPKAPRRQGTADGFPRMDSRGR